MSIAQALSKSSRSPGGVILVADEDAASLKAISTIFEKAGWRVSFAHNGDEALNIIDEANVNAIMLDRRRSELDDCEVCRQLLDLGRTIPSMLISGCVGNQHPSRPVNLEQTLIKLITTEELQAFARTAPSRFVWHGNTPDIVVTRTPGKGQNATPKCSRQANAPNRVSFLPA